MSLLQSYYITPELPCRVVNIEKSVNNLFRTGYLSVFHHIDPL